MDTKGVDEPMFFGTFKLRDDLACFKGDPCAYGIIVVKLTMGQISLLTPSFSRNSLACRRNFSCSKSGVPYREFGASVQSAGVTPILIKTEYSSAHASSKSVLVVLIRLNRKIVI